MENNKEHKVLNAPALRFPEFDGEWENCTISDFGVVVTGSTPSTKESINYDNGTRLWVSPSDMGICKYISDTRTKLSNVGFAKTKIIPKGATFVTCVGSIGKMGMASCEMSTNQQINSVIANNNTDSQYLYYAIQAKFPTYTQFVATQVVPIISKSIFEQLANARPSIKEQKKIGALFDYLDQRIAVQIRAIEDLKRLKSAIIEKEYAHGSMPKVRLADLIEQKSIRNKKDNIKNTLSVSNKSGFVKQDEQFDGREIASEDKSNYKIVSKGDFAYNPARINVGSIARLETETHGIVSPMYIIFAPKELLDGSYLLHFFDSKHFADEVEKRLEGSVRLCLSFESLCQIEIPLPNKASQTATSERISSITKKIELEENFLKAYKDQKQYLLRQMFI